MALDGPKALLISHMEMSDTAAVDGPISRLTSVLETTFEFRLADGSDI